MNRLLIASLGITVAALVVGFALGTQFQSISTLQARTTTVTVTPNQTTMTGNTASIICMVMAEAGVLVHLINYSGAPIVGANVSSYSLTGCYDNQVSVNRLM